ncbi:hypothetical protein BIFADO_01444 [Bifidobacterium adolescentis L2-32]|uniref:Uncharacterized protein n=1 Tax=Bifidobacterium adolescentis L2-32 TaxID=411481 RepID=A7A6G2_BIFAD|nr:hypothetical protein BIFADO_01444 [Bifidobacterium adolescentis L2-32]
MPTTAQRCLAFAKCLRFRGFSISAIRGIRKTGES